MVKTSEVPFLIGVRFGELSRYIDTVIETSTRQRRRERIEIKVFYVYESIKYLHDELSKLSISDEVVNDIDIYIGELAKRYGEIKQKVAIESDRGAENQMIVSKLKKKLSIQRKDQPLRMDDATQLAMKLKIWKDRITIEMSRLMEDSEGETI